MTATISLQLYTVREALSAGRKFLVERGLR
ncbi:hypothetical protein SAMN06296010_0874 [Agreia pratensis]|uniref:Uncharacterized protein n=1 Tax=Agreia pratensis TaxID=150121 RepID=A0A1X7ITX6_9MICO|nr:hypothetical protein SAMN06296010_0874 [Agreia pratensis]